MREEMREMLRRGQALDVRREGRALPDEGIYELRRFVEGKAYVDSQTGRLIGSIGQRFSDNRIFASCDARFADNENFSVLFVS